MLANGGGVVAVSSTGATTTASVNDSIISGINNGVFAVTALAGGFARVFVTRCTIEGVTDALSSTTQGSGSTLVTVSGSTITNNVNGWKQTGAGSEIKSLGNNHIQDNAGNTGTLTTVALQ